MDIFNLDYDMHLYAKTSTTKSAIIDLGILCSELININQEIADFPEISLN